MSTRRVRAASASNIYRPPPARLNSREEQPSSDQDAKPTGGRQRRPDIQVYVPRARRVSNEPSPQPSTLSPPSSTQPKSSRHRNSSPNVVTPRKKSQKPAENPALLSSTTASSESDIYDLDDTTFTENDKNSKTDTKYLPYFVKSDILLPNSELVTEKSSSSCNNNKKDKLYKRFVKSNEIYSSTNLTGVDTADDQFTAYLENSTKIESEFSKFLQKDHDEEPEDQLTEYLQQQISSQTPDKLTEYLETTTKSSSEIPDRLGEYLQKLPKSDTTNVTLVEPSKNIITPVLKISSAPLEEPLDVIGEYMKEENKKVKRSNGKAVTKSVSENGKSSESSPKKSNLNIEECSWDMLFDENGDCLEPSIMDELTRQVGKVKVERPTSDYTAYENAREAILAETDFPHVLEVYGFPAEFKTQDLMTVLTPLAGRAGFDLKWVDDTHALAVFSNSQIAAEVLSYQHPMLKTRPLSQACPESKVKARRSGDFLQPYRARPETCTAMAKRLVSSALGVRLPTSKEEREKERTLLKEAREKKRLAARQSEEAWEGKISSK